MRHFSAAAFLLGTLVPALAVPARAQDQAVGSGAFFQRVSGPWEFGVDLGYAVPTQKASFSSVVNNQRAYDLLNGEGVGDEVAEGWVAPPLPGESTVAGTMRGGADVGAHLYRRVNSWLAAGLDAGYLLKREVHVDNPGIYVPSNFLTLLYNASILHASFPAKVGPELGGVRPYLLAGPGVYLVQQRATIGFNDPDDPQLKPIDVVHRDTLRFGLDGGVGIEDRLGQGLIGLEVQYHRIFAGKDHVDFYEPRLRFAVRF
jgi:hypothetical protein